MSPRSCCCCCCYCWLRFSSIATLTSWFGWNYKLPLLQRTQIFPNSFASGERILFGLPICSSDFLKTLPHSTHDSVIKVTACTWGVLLLLFFLQSTVCLSVRLFSRPPLLPAPLLPSYFLKCLRCTFARTEICASTKEGRRKRGVKKLLLYISDSLPLRSVLGLLLSAQMPDYFVLFLRQRFKFILQILPHLCREKNITYPDYWFRMRAVLTEGQPCLLVKRML